MATLQQVRDRADIKLASIWSKLKQQQDSYFQKNGKFFQLLVTGGRIVENDEHYIFTVQLPSDETNTKDIDTSWSDVLPFEMEVHEWVGPYDYGYRVMVTVQYKNKIYQRHRDNLQYDSGWFVYTL